MATLLLPASLEPTGRPSVRRAVRAAVPRPERYPLCEPQIPAWIVRRPPYRARFARTPRDLEAAQRLRYRVFNLELGEGLAASRATGRDADAFDATSHHLLVIDERDDIVVGTYRLSTLELASHGTDFYAAGEFDLSGLAADALAAGVELGRACIAAPHRGQTVLALLFQGISAYVTHNHKRFLFGCASLPRQLAPAASRLTAELRAQGRVDAELRVRPRAGYEPPPDDPSVVAGKDAVPPLVRRYLRLGARVAAEPAFDRDFGTLDYFTWLDVRALSAAPPQLVRGSPAPVSARA
jgi:putative hemolysin